MVGVGEAEEDRRRLDLLGVVVLVVLVLSPFSILGQAAIHPFLEAETDEGEAADHEGDAEAGRDDPPLPGAREERPPVRCELDHAAPAPSHRVAEPDEAQRQLEQDGDAHSARTARPAAG